jgi:phosphoglycolate phosphatase
MRRRPAVLFDLDGVLVDSRAAITGCISHALAENGLRSRSRESLERFIGPPLSEAFCELTGRPEGDPLVGACVASYRRRYAVDSLMLTTLTPGIRDALENLAARHVLAVATSKSPAFAEPLVGAVGLRAYFARIVGPDLDAHGDKATIIDRALRDLGRPSQAVMVGDRSHDVIGAHANHIPCVGVSWGIGSKRELAGAGATLTRSGRLSYPRRSRPCSMISGEIEGLVERLDRA